MSQVQVMLVGAAWRGLAVATIVWFALMGVLEWRGAFHGLVGVLLILFTGAALIAAGRLSPRNPAVRPVDNIADPSHLSNVAVRESFVLCAIALPIALALAWLLG